MKTNDKLIWHTEKRKVSDLTPYERNPRRLTDKQAEKLKESLEKFDLVEIPAVDLDGKIIAGHMRVNILRSLGRDQDEIDVRIPNRKLTKEEFKEYNIRSNANTGEWDWDILANEFEIEDLKEWGIEPLDYFLREQDGLIKNKHGNLADSFGIPPFSVLNAREGWWQARKAAWIALGIKSELGRGGG